MFHIVKFTYKFLVAIFAIVGITVVALVAWAASYFIRPDVSFLKTGNPEKTAFMELREKEWAEKGRKVKVHRKWVPLSEIPGFVQEAVIISEDDKFWSHYGFDLEGIQEALERNMKSGKARAGGSTITQQLAKNIFLTPERSLNRKLKEAALTIRLERSLGKKRILELYLNVAEWGDGIFGVGAAAERYYGKTPRELTPVEACRLAAALPNPLRFRPTGSTRFVDKRADYIMAILKKRSEGDAAFRETPAPEEPAGEELPGDEIASEPPRDAPQPPEAPPAPTTGGSE